MSLLCGNPQTAGSSWRSRSRCIRWASPTVAGCIWQAASTRCRQTTWSRNRPLSSPDRRCWSVWCRWWRWGKAPTRRNSWTQTPSPCRGSTWGPERHSLQRKSNIQKNILPEQMNTVKSNFMYYCKNMREPEILQLPIITPRILCIFLCIYRKKAM